MSTTIGATLQTKRVSRKKKQSEADLRWANSKIHGTLIYVTGLTTVRRWQTVRWHPELMLWDAPAGLYNNKMPTRRSGPQTKRQATLHCRESGRTLDFLIAMPNLIVNSFPRPLPFEVTNISLGKTLTPRVTGTYSSIIFGIFPCLKQGNTLSLRTCEQWISLFTCSWYSVLPSLNLVCYSLMKKLDLIISLLKNLSKLIQN